MDDLHLSDEVIRELEGLAVRTSQGSYVKVDDVRRLMDKKRTAGAVQEATTPEKLTVDKARGLAREYLKKVGFGAPQPQEPGRSIPATEPQPSSRT